ncbi:MAG: hypothetical protein ACRDU0_19775, partial [Mycobacterium sp.]
MSDPIVIVRIVHYGSLVLLAGILEFLMLVAEPAFRRGNRAAPVGVVSFRQRLIRLAWLSLVTVLGSGAFWFLLVAASMAGGTLRETLSLDTASTVLMHTHFGLVWRLRLLFVAGCGVCLAWMQTRTARRETGGMAG